MQGVGVLLICALCAVCVDSSFLSTTIQVMADIVQTANTPSVQMGMVFERELFDLNAGSTPTHIRALQYIQLIGCSVPLRSLCFVRTSGFVSCYEQQGGFFTTSTSSTATCTDSQIAPPCTNTFSVSAQGTPATFTSSQHIDTRKTSWYNTTVSQNSAAALLEPGNSVIYLTQTTPIHSANRTTLGVASTTFPLSVIDKLFEKLVLSSSEPSRCLFAMERETGRLIAASVPNATFTTNTTTGESFPIHVSQVSDLVIRRVGEHLLNYIGPEALKEANKLVYNKLNIETERLFDDRGKDWVLVACYPAAERTFQITPHSTQYYVLLALIIAVALVTAFLFAWVAHFRNLRLWTAAQPSMLLMILASNLVMCTGCITLISATSDASCLARQWIVYIAALFNLLALLAAFARSYTVGTILSEPKLNVSDRTALAVVGTVLSICILIEAIWTIVSPLRLDVEVDKPDTYSDVELVNVCTSTDNSILIALTAVLLGVVLAGLRIVYIARELDTPFIENQALMLLFLQMSGVTIGVAVALKAMTHKQESFLIVTTLLWLGCILSTHLLLFVPRVYRQIKKGDLTVDEIRNQIKERIAAVAQRQARLEQRQARVHVPTSERMSAVSPMGLTVVI